MLGVDACGDKVIHDGEDFTAAVQEKRLVGLMHQGNDFFVGRDDVGGYRNKDDLFMIQWELMTWKK
ncbi:hypothetical protein AGMMS49940_23560 [Spirochaetia bacterium]|nr:hypothetical protein AGMMS49940_23560 [Spirochaetia bacterium]